MVVFKIIYRTTSSKFKIVNITRFPLNIEYEYAEFFSSWLWSRFVIKGRDITCSISRFFYISPMRHDINLNENSEFLDKFAVISRANMRAWISNVTFAMWRFTYYSKSVMFWMAFNFENVEISNWYIDKNDITETIAADKCVFTIFCIFAHHINCKNGIFPS